MRYYLNFYNGQKGEYENQEVSPQEIRDASVGETIVLSSFFPDDFVIKTRMLIRDIEIEKGKRTYLLSTSKVFKDS